MSAIIVAVKDPSEAGQGEVANREMERYQPCSNAVDKVVEKIGV